MERTADSSGDRKGRTEMKILITHFSQTGNTAKVARAIHEAVSSRGHEGDLREIGEVTAESLNEYDLVYLGSACHDTDLAKPVKRLLEEIGGLPPFKLALPPTLRRCPKRTRERENCTRDGPGTASGPFIG
jgi:hypothetical protein